MNSKTKLPTLHAAGQLVWDICLYSPLYFTLTFCFMLLRSVTSGIGILLIIPLLQTIGITVWGNTNQVLTRHMEALLTAIHLPMNLPSILLCYVLIMVLVGVANYAEEIVSHRLQEHYNHHLREQIHRDILQVKWSFFMRKKISDILHQIMSQVQSTSVCQFQILSIMNTCVVISVYVTLSFFLSWQMTLLAVLCSAALFSITFPIFRLTAKLGKQFLNRNQSIFNGFYEQLNALKLIKSCHFEKQFLQKTLCENRSLVAHTRQLTQMRAFSKLLFSCGSVVSLSLILYAAIEIFKLPAGALFLLLIVFSRLLPLISSLQQNTQQLIRHLPFYHDLRVFQEACLVHRESFEEDGGSIDIPFERTISLHDIGFSYQPGTLPQVLSHFSLTIKKNTTTALIGPSGVGKTTVADLLVGLLVPDSGVIAIDGTPITARNRKQWGRSAAYVIQNSFLFNATIRENLRIFCKDATDDMIWDALAKVSAAPFVRALDEGLDTVVGERGIRLSGGECQRIALARALVMNPKLLVLDESTNSLDSEAIQTIQTALAALKGKMTILIISHQTEMSQFADQIVTLDRPVGSKQVVKEVALLAETG